eukprot:SAG11_NODE_3717_length_2262_cov_4.740638_2_plen_230_part_00
MALYRHVLGSSADGTCRYNCYHVLMYKVVGKQKKAIKTASDNCGYGSRRAGPNPAAVAAELGMQEDHVAALLLGLRLLIKDRTITAKSLNEEPLSTSTEATEATDDSQQLAEGATHDSPPLVSTGDHGPQQQTTSTRSTDSPGAAPKTGGGTAAPDQGAQVTHDSQQPAESAAADSQQLAEGATHDSPPLASTGDHGPQQQTTSTRSTDSPGLLRRLVGVLPHRTRAPR